MDSDEFTFDDIEPIPIDQPSNGEINDIVLCKILYSEEYKTIMGYLRRLMLNKEYSERAIYLTDLVIQKVAAHYTVWQYRLQCIKALGKDLIKELEWTEEIALENHKNYQIWHYRQLLIDDLRSQKSSSYSPSLDFPLIEIMIDEDSKNYHVWSHRRWIVENFKLYHSPKELEFVESKIEEDVRNNSAWNHRFFVQFGDYKLNATEPEDDLIQSEVEYAKNQIKLAPLNPSSWNYLNGIYKLFFSKLSLSEIQEFVEQYTDKQIVAEGEEETIKSNFAYETLAQIMIWENDLPGAKKIFQQLAFELDTFRVNYWNYKITRLGI